MKFVVTSRHQSWILLNQLSDYLKLTESKFRKIIIQIILRFH